MQHARDWLKITENLNQLHQEWYLQHGTQFVVNMSHKTEIMQKIFDQIAKQINCSTFIKIQQLLFNYIDKLSDHVAKYFSEFEASNQYLNSIKISYDDIQQKYRSSITQYNKQEWHIKNAQANREELKRQMEHIQKQMNDQLYEQKVLYSDKLQQQNLIINEQQEKIEQLENNISKLKKNNNQLLQNESNLSQSLNTQISSVNNNKNSEIQQLLNQLHNSRKQQNELHEQNLLLQNEKQQLIIEIGNSKKQYNTLAKEYQNQKQQFTKKYSKDLNSAKKSNSLLSLNTNIKSQIFENDQETELKQIQERNMEMMKQLEKQLIINKEQEVKIEKLQIDFKSMLKKIRQQEQDLQARDNKIKFLEIENTKLQQNDQNINNQDMQQLIKQYKAEISELQKQIELSNKSNISSPSSIQQSPVRNIDNYTYISNEFTQTYNNTAHKSKLNTSSKIFQNSIKSTSSLNNNQDDIAKKQQEIELLQSLLKIQNADITKLKKDKQSLENNISQLTRQMFQMESFGKQEPKKQKLRIRID